MRHFRWDQGNEVFLPLIDAEHRELYGIADGLQQALAGGAGAEVQTHLNRFTSHVNDHFTHEEWLMQSVGYPSYGWHKQQHETVRRRLKLFTPMILEGNAEATDVFFEFMAQWLQDHTSVTDRMMGAYVRNYERSQGTSLTERWHETHGRDLPQGAADGEGPFPKTVRLCEVCGDHTTHEMRPSGLVCLTCADRSVTAELDRD